MTQQNNSSPAPTGSGTPKSGGKKSGYAVLIAYLVGLSAFGSFVNDMYQPTLPAMTRFFHCSIPMVQMGLAMGMLGLALGQFLLGPVSDKVGRKPVLVGSLLVFCVAADASVFARNIHFFLLCRFVQGVGAAGAYFLARTIPADLYGGRQLAKVMALVGAINGFAPASAPVLGGIVADHFNWQGVFVALVAFALLLLAFSYWLKETLPPSKRTHGSVWSGFADYGILLHYKPFMIHVLLKGAALGLLFAYISSSPFIFEDHYGFSQTHFGLIMGLNAMFTAAGSMLALKFRLLKQAAFAGAWGLAIAVAIEAAAMFVFDHFLIYELALIPILFFLGMLFTSGNALAMNEGRDKAGTASAILGIGGYMFGAVSSPMVGVGNIMHSSAIVFGVLAAITLIAAYMSRALPAEANQP